MMQHNKSENEGTDITDARQNATTQSNNVTPDKAKDNAAKNAQFMLTLSNLAQQVKELVITNGPAVVGAGLLGVASLALGLSPSTTAAATSGGLLLGYVKNRADENAHTEKTIAKIEIRQQVLTTDQQAKIAEIKTQAQQRALILQAQHDKLIAEREENNRLRKEKGIALKSYPALPPILTPQQIEELLLDAYTKDEAQQSSERVNVKQTLRYQSGFEDSWVKVKEQLDEANTAATELIAQQPITGTNTKLTSSYR